MTKDFKFHGFESFDLFPFDIITFDLYNIIAYERKWLNYIYIKSNELKYGYCLYHCIRLLKYHSIGYFINGLPDDFSYTIQSYHIKIP